MPGFRFNADEIFTMAEQIERNGARFYRRAAENFPAVREQLILLAEMEDQHLATFEQMHTNYDERDIKENMFDPEGQAAAYLSAMADDHVVDVKKDPTEALRGKATLEEILQVAIGLEKDSIIFYVGMKDFVPAELGKDEVERIIREEMQHIALIKNVLKMN
jgi:rubrerythrin